ncbi:MAG: J domain-containing protein [Deltaproteobacteria bacterium]|jgi:curved DNA-binding protein CbpA|nr:J domain-containing protein [Deltaproteobacteria bacterium]MDX9762161.1 J domain-containing protein [Desulfomonilia bacterium]
MGRYEEITGARELLELPESATMGEIRANYRRLILKWHPDRCRENPELCREMTEGLIAAYETLVSYCRDYRFSFAEQEVAKYLSGKDWWLRRFGDDPLWGGGKKKK